MLKACGLGHSFDYELFSDINLELKPATSTAILGVSGSGKSTILHILSTLLKPKFGEVFYKGKSIYEMNDKDLCEVRRLEFGIIFQSHYLFKGFNAYENIELSSVLCDNFIDEDILRQLKISDVIRQKVGDLSGGQQQRVSITRVLTKKPKILFADEPTGNLDKTTANDVMDFIFNYVKSTSAALCLVTHDENLAKKCDQIYKLENKIFTQLK